MFKMTTIIFYNIFSLCSNEQHLWRYALKQLSLLSCFQQKLAGIKSEICQIQQTRHIQKKNALSL